MRSVKLSLLVGVQCAAAALPCGIVGSDGGSTMGTERPPVPSNELRHSGARARDSPPRDARRYLETCLTVSAGDHSGHADGRRAEVGPPARHSTAPHSEGRPSPTCRPSYRH